MTHQTHNTLDKLLSNITSLQDKIEVEQPLKIEGSLVRSVGLTLEAKGFRAPIGTLCKIELSDLSLIDAVVTGFSEETLYLMPLCDIRGLELGNRVISCNKIIDVSVSPKMLGRIIDGFGNPLDGKDPLEFEERRCLLSDVDNPMEKKLITEVLDVGVKAINGLLTIGKGQRIGLFAGSGVGKSVLLGMISKFTQADVVVVALIGERSREVKEFIEYNLGPEGLKKAVVVASPASYPPVLRLYGAMMATTIAEYFRDQGKHVLLLMDSLTRFAQAQREIALAMGEPPATKGYPPSVFSMLPQLIERAGNGQINNGGSITGIFSVLVEGDDHNDPVADASRAILDGHIVLSRNLADVAHYPAIDIGSSVSRVMSSIVTKEHLLQANHFKKIQSIHEENKDLINIGAYATGSNPDLDFAIANMPAMNQFLQQSMNESYDFHNSINQLRNIISINEQATN